MKDPSEEKLRDLLSLSPAILYCCRPSRDFNVTFVSDSIKRLLGYSVEACLENPDFWRDNLHPEDAERVLADVPLLFEKGHHVHEYRFRKKDGSFAWILDESFLIRDESGDPLEITGSWLDVTERKAAEETLHTNQGLFREFFLANPMATIITTPSGLVERVNPAFVKASGYSAEEVVGLTAQALGFWRNQQDRERMVTAVTQRGFIDNMECVLVGKGGREMTCLVSSRAIELDGQLRILNIVMDVTEHQKTARKLRKSEALFRDFFLANPVPTIISSPDGVVLMVNKAFTVNPGYPAEDVVGRTVQDLGFWRIPEDRDRMVSEIKKYGFVDNQESQFLGQGKRAMTCLISSRAIEFEGELQIISTVHDITEQRQAEAAMRQLEKSKSDFISTVAHELRTPLIAIVGYCELLENAASMGFNAEQKEHYLSVIQSNAEILNILVDDLLDIGRIQIGRSLGVSPKENNLLEIVEKVVASFRLKTSRHEIVIDQDNTLPETIWLDAGRIAQVLHNLLSNALKFSPEGGPVKVILKGGQDRVEVSIADCGIGMTAEQIEHMFERFYRVDSESLETIGLGLGMSIVKQIIDDHGGDIEATSQPGEGTTVTFHLPVRR